MDLRARLDIEWEYYWRFEREWNHKYQLESIGGICQDRKSIGQYSSDCVKEFRGESGLNYYRIHKAE